MRSVSPFRSISFPEPVSESARSCDIGKEFVSNPPAATAVSKRIAISVSPVLPFVRMTRTVSIAPAVAFSSQSLTRTRIESLEDCDVMTAPAALISQPAPVAPIGVPES